MKQWTRSETLALAKQSCGQCYGLGLRPGRNGTSNPCKCVLRAIFRACFARFRQCALKEKYISKVTLDSNPGTKRSVWGMKNEEYLADFCLVARRTLHGEEYALFKYHFLLGADWKLCTRKLKIDRGTFFHSVYRIQEKLGKVFRELEPFALYPLDEYFNSTARSAVPEEVHPLLAVDAEPEEVEPAALRFPLIARAA